MGDPLLQTPNRIRREITTSCDTQFSVFYDMALAVLYGDSPGPQWQMPATYDDPRIKELMGKVQVSVHPPFEKFAIGEINRGKVPVFLRALVEVVVKGKTFSKEISSPKGTPDAPICRAELVDTFRTNASYSIIKTGKVDEIIEIVDHLKRIGEVRDLPKLLTL